MAMTDLVRDMCMALRARGVIVVVLGEEGPQVGSFGFTVKGQNIAYALDDLVHRNVFDIVTGRLDATAMRNFADELDRDSSDLEEYLRPTTGTQVVELIIARASHCVACDDVETTRPHLIPVRPKRG